jgi:hypothetical protein
MDIVALRDLVADHRKLAEEKIEEIVSPYIRYDPAAHRIVATPIGRALGNDAQVLVFLVAVQGWQYVLDDSLDVSTRPVDLERELGIAGGTLRPILKKLKDSHLITVADGHYRVQTANLDLVQSVIAGDRPAAPRSGAARTKVREKREKPGEDPAERPEAARRKRARGGRGPLKEYLTKWIGEGFFREPKTIGDLLQRFHEYGVITKQTSLSGLLLDAVRDGLLGRTKSVVGGKQLWTYQAK